MLPVVTCAYTLNVEEGSNLDSLFGTAPNSAEFHLLDADRSSLSA